MEEQTGRARHRLGRRASCQPLPPAELATTAATATAAISSSMTCFTSGPNGAFSVASLIRVLAWRRPERSGATRSRSRQGPASARSTADRGASGRQASVQVRLGAERHGALDGIESDKDELLRDQHDLSVFRTRGRGQIRLSTAATTTAVAPAVLFG